MHHHVVKMLQISITPNSKTMYKLKTVFFTMSQTHKSSTSENLSKIWDDDFHFFLKFTYL